MLPRIEGQSYLINEKIILIDKDIKNMWQEHLVIRQKLQNLKQKTNKSFQKSILYEVYREFLNSEAGQLYSKANDKNTPG